MLPDLVAQWRYSWRRGSNAATATGSVLAGLALQKAEEDGVAIDEEHNRSSHAKKPPSTVAGRGKISEPSTVGTSNLDWRYFEYY